MTDRFQTFIDTYHLFSSQDRLLVACSGGLDSAALVHLLHQCGYTFGIAHCNFQLRGEESDADARFVRALADRFAVPYHEAAFATTAEKQAGESIQMAARRLRYTWLEHIRQEHSYTWLLTAHHLYDSLETFLLNFSRGTGLAGLQGIPLQTATVRRPLLGMTRPELAAWVQEQQIAYREDASNAQEKYRRNRLRHQVVPILEEINPALATTLAANFAYLRDAYTLYQQGLFTYTARLLQITDQGWIVARNTLRAEPLAATLLHEWLHPHGFTPEQLRQVLEAQPGTTLQATGGQLFISSILLRFVAEVVPLPSILIPQVPGSFTLPTGQQLVFTPLPAPPHTFSADDNQTCIAADQLVYPLTVRYWQDGDTFQPLGMQGRHQKLQDYFVNNKLDAWQRRHLPLLLNGNGDIIWLIGHRLDERYKIQATTTTVMQIKVQ